MGKGLGTAGETHALAKVVAAGLAKGAMLAHDAGLDCNALAGHQVFYARAHGNYYACGLVAEDKGGLDGKVAIPPIEVVVD